MPEPFLQVGDLVENRYRIERPLAEGGMGILFLAADLRLNSRRTVLKFPKAQFLAEVGFRERFIRECETLIDQIHGNIVTVYDAGGHRDTPFLALEYMSGGSLDDRVRQGPLPAGEVAHWLPGIADALDHLHSQGIFHRDVKAANILFRNAKTACISDFGIAKTLISLEREAYATGKTLPSTAGALGSIETLAPEHTEEDHLSPHYDQYGLATAVYRALSGQLPFQAERTPAAYRFALVAKEPRPLIEIAPQVGSAAAAVVMRALSMKPTARYPNCKAFAEAFNSALAAPVATPPEDRGIHQNPATAVPSTATVQSQPAVSPQAPGRRIRTALLAIALIATISAVLLSIQKQAHTIPAPALAPIPASPSAPVQAEETTPDPTPVPEPASALSIHDAIGLSVRPLNEGERREAKLGEGRGVMVVAVGTGPAATAGVREKDVLMQISGRDTPSPEQYEEIATQLPVGKTVPVLVIRRGSPLFLALTVPSAVEPPPLPPAHPTLGLSVSPLTDGSGAVVTAVDNGPANRAGVRTGDLLLRLRGQSINDPVHFGEMEKTLTPGESVQLQIQRSGIPMYMSLNMPSPEATPDEVKKDANADNLAKRRAAAAPSVTAKTCTCQQCGDLSGSTRERWRRDFLLPWQTDHWRVFVMTLKPGQGDASAERARQSFLAKHPQLDFDTMATVSADMQSNQRQAIVIAEGLADAQAAWQIALYARACGVASDAYAYQQFR